MGCGCGGSRNRTTAATSHAKTVAPAAKLFEVVKDGRVIFRTRDENVAKGRRDSNPGSHYRAAGSTTPL